LFFSYTIDLDPVGKRDGRNSPVSGSSSPKVKSKSGHFNDNADDDDIQAPYLGFKGIDFERLRKSKGYSDFNASTIQLKSIDRSDISEVSEENKDEKDTE
jgi:hypothetical protein